MTSLRQATWRQEPRGRQVPEPDLAAEYRGCEPPTAPPKASAGMRQLELIGAGQPWRLPARPGMRSSRNRHRLAWPREVPLNSFAIPLGVAALGGVWSSGAAALAITALPAQALFAVAALLWLAFTVAYAAGAIGRRAFIRDLHHPARGPYAAYIPVIAMLLVTH